VAVQSLLSQIFIFFIGRECCTLLRGKIDMKCSGVSATCAAFLIGSKRLSCQYSVGQKTVFMCLASNSAESEPMWMKSGTMLAKCWVLAMADFGAICAVVTV